MGIFGRRAARQRLRRAARQSLLTPVFGPPLDCTPWVIGGLWPAELSAITAQTATLAEYLNTDLQRIVNSTNERLRKLRQADMPGSIRQVEEDRVIKLARESAVLRVESTVRHMRNNAPAFRTRNLVAAERTTTVLRPVAGPAKQSAVEPAGGNPTEDGEEQTESGRPEVAAVDLNQAVIEPEPLGEPEAGPAPSVEPDVEHDPVSPAPELVVTTAEAPTEALVTTPLKEVPTEALLTTPLKEVPTEELAHQPLQEEQTEKLATTPANDDPAEQQAEQPLRGDGPTAELTTRTLKLGARHRDDATDKLTPKHAAADIEREPGEPDSDHDRLQRLLAFVARQQPELGWAVGDRADGATVVVTDLAHGWIPPGIVLPTGVRLLEPGRRGGDVGALLGPATPSVTYAPGDRLGWATDFDPVESSSQPRELPLIDDLGWLLSEATHWRDGLPRLANTLAKAGAAGTGVVDSEMDLLRVDLDTLRYRLLNQYPDVDAEPLLNCLLLAATEGIAAGDTVSANYHFAWFQALSAPPADRWGTHPD